MRAGILIAGLAVACEPTTATPSDAEHASASTILWTDVRPEIEALVCVARLPADDASARELPVFGDRALCDLPPARTPIERAVARAFTGAHDVLLAFPEEKRAAQQAVTTADPQARVGAVRNALLTDRFLAPVQRRLVGTLRDEGLACPDCPRPMALPTRAVSWSALAPYVAAYVWPDRVVTPRDADGTPTGLPQYSMHICVGINGLAQMPAIDEDLRFAAQIGAFHTAALHDRAAEVMRATLREAAFVALGDDEARTTYLRERIGPRVAEDPAVRAGICDTLARFEADTPVRVEGC